MNAPARDDADATQTLLRQLEHAIEVRDDALATSALDVLALHFSAPQLDELMGLRTPMVVLIAERGLTVTLERWLSMGADPDRPVSAGKSNLGETALSRAVTSNCPGSVALLVGFDACLDVGLGRKELICEAIGHDSPDLLAALRPSLAELRLPPHALLSAAARGAPVALIWLMDQGLSPLEEVRPGVSVLRNVVQVTGDVMAISTALVPLLHRSIDEGLGAADVRTLLIDAGNDERKAPVREVIRRAMAHACAADALREIGRTMGKLGEPAGVRS